MPTFFILNSGQTIIKERKVSVVCVFAGELLVPASVTEKFMAKLLLLFAALVIPLGIHALACALGLNGITCFFADGFEVGSIAMIMLCSSIIVWASNYRLGADSPWGSMGNLGIFMYFASFAVINGIETANTFPAWEIAIIFTVAILLQVVSFYLYKKRQDIH